MQIVESKWPGDNGKKEQLSIIKEHPQKKVRMAYLCIVGAHSVNGVAAIHTEILKNGITSAILVIFVEVFSLFYQIWPEKFNNKTNGVTPRRWIHQANRNLSNLLSSVLKGDRWVTQLSELVSLKPLATNPDFQERFAMCKRLAKVRHLVSQGQTSSIS